MSTFTPILAAQPRHILLRALIFALVAASPAFAQIGATPPTTEALLVLPDSPGTALSNRPIDISSSIPSSNPDEALAALPPFPLLAAAFQNVPPDNGPVAGRFDKYIKPGQRALPLTVGDKLALGVKDAVSPLSAIGWILAAGYEQLLNGSPNYGTNRTAFAQRFGASVARAASEGIFSDSIMASVLREDPRYYKMGSGHSFLKRAAYAATRPLITRTDGGHTTVNLAYLSGNLAGAALTQAYYPPVNRGFSQVAQTFGGSIGGGALGFLTSEFLDDALRAIHLRKAQ